MTTPRPAQSSIRVLFDATRLLARTGLATPTGIDRVDLAYVAALSGAPGFDLQPITFDVLGPRLLGQRLTKRLIESALQRWQTPAGDDQPRPAFQRVRTWLEAPAGTGSPARPEPAEQTQTDGTPLRRAASVLNETLGALRPRRTVTNGMPSIYLNTSHGRLFRKSISRWLGGSGVGGVFFVHDLIPIEFPEFQRPREPARHVARMQIISEHARQVIVNSEATKSALTRYFREQNRRVPPIEALCLGIEDRFNTTAGDVAALSPAKPYFVVLGTIEPRKNHLLLLQVWRRLVETAGEAAPRLVLIGRRGWENHAAFNLLDRYPPLSRHVIECSGLGDQDIATLLRGARALLSPSFSEGFGLPVVEALALGTPVLASDIAAHREVGGGFAEYLDPMDGLGWLQAVHDYSGEASARREDQLRRLSAYKSPGWSEHLPSALQLIRDAAIRQ
jgi:glycosyltransferase involved in cell wall biosynthesis